MTTQRGFGVAGTLDHTIVREVSQAAEAVGYATFWANDTPGGDGLASLAAAAEVTTTIRLGVGVIPLDRQGPERIAARVRELGLPEGRLVLGVGSGAAAGGLARVRDGVPVLRDLTGARIAVGALGPKMCALAGEVADEVLLNWLTPIHAAGSAEVVRGAAARAGRATPRLDGYVRVALGAAAFGRLREEAERYAAFPAYAANFARMGAAAIETCVGAGTPDGIAAGLAAFAGVVDETVVRAIVADETAEAYLAVVRAGV